jgi:hypothetical protein
MVNGLKGANALTTLGYYKIQGQIETTFDVTRYRIAVLAIYILVSVGILIAGIIIQKTMVHFKKSIVHGKAVSELASHQDLILSHVSMFCMCLPIGFPISGALATLPLAGISYVLFKMIKRCHLIYLNRMRNTYPEGQKLNEQQLRKFMAQVREDQILELLKQCDAEQMRWMAEILGPKKMREHEEKLLQDVNAPHFIPFAKTFPLSKRIAIAWTYFEKTTKGSAPLSTIMGKGISDGVFTLTPMDQELTPCKHLNDILSGKEVNLSDEEANDVVLVVHKYYDQFYDKALRLFV